MSRKISAIAIIGFALLVVLGTVHQAMAQAAATPYSKMAPIDQYLMADRSAEIALARSAAPESISRDAEVMILGRHGFETAVKGKNGFVCAVGRSWTSTVDAEFWNPKVRVPLCVNAAAARSYLLRVTKETEWGLAGRTPAQMNEAIAAAIARKELPPMEPGAMCYMMSKEGYGGDSVPHWPSHLMFFYGCRPRKLGSESAGFPRHWCERLRGTPDAVRGGRATVVRRNGISRRPCCGASTLAPIRLPDLCGRGLFEDAVGWCDRYGEDRRRHSHSTATRSICRNPRSPSGRKSRLSTTPANGAASRAGRITSFQNPRF